MQYMEQPVPVKMRLQLQIEILAGQSSCLFSNEPLEKRPVMTITDFVWHCDAPFESHLLGNGLFMSATLHVYEIEYTLYVYGIYKQ